MAVHYRTQGFILEKKDLKEADQLFTVFSKEFGKIEVLGRAIRKISSKLRSGIDLFYLCDLEFIQGKNYKTLTDAIVIEKFKDIRNGLERLEIIQKIAETADLLIKGEEKDDAIWDLLTEALDRFKVQNLKFEILFDYFLWNLLSISGYRPDLYHCSKCQQRLTPLKNYFLPEEKGIICFKCSDDSQKNKICLSSETIKLIRIFLKKDWNLLSKLVIPRDCEEELGSLSDCLIKSNFSWYH